ncbi:SDR family NAD(P)-dependent oxidoreductase [Agrobacterium tumefaciens]|uniref:SDR family oxidoreductase n=1 Tax=Agrobacterium tumefaciens TaxID=358 RepID=A0AA44JA77_AGRTU|nr:SDR family oxidoreductase [Agrobacterium tumefaciens]NSL21294.1 SDR family oxidoreductase [Agrobacterium tumefaciens]NTB83866.1 SDR family oxidoreductase [Agrobacterium tumefaciens]NTC20665.1 SDR family oxidoreductase [Agrobacterium tumefaciens]NTC29337.1 SDR family oxidoreductase [Agrobacterium tumefaciens]NTC57833.1 SDR family oxidoreductase [Agrobacterium tumefaciens]
MRVLVTGVSEGIGGTICREIASKPNSAIAMCVRKSRESAVRLADELRHKGCDVLILEGDLRDPAVPGYFVGAATDAFKGLDAIVSNAGAVDPTSLEDMSLDVWEDMFALTCRASWLLAKEGFPHLKKSRGAYVAISSQSGVHPHRQTGAYSAAKAALIMLCKQMALEWGEHGIRVNSVSPGMIMTPMTRSIYDDDDITRQREAIVPLKRIGAPIDVARLVDFLIDPNNRYITGENIMVDGGLTLSVLDRIPGIARRKADAVSSGAQNA